MLRLLRIALVGVTLLPVAAAESASNDVVRRVITACGVADTLEAMPAQIQASLLSVQDRLAPELRDTLSEIVHAAYEPRAIETHIVAGVTAALTDEDARAVQQFCQSPLGRRVISLEAVQRRSKQSEEFQRFVEAARQVPPSPSRFNLLEQMEAHTDARRLAMRLVEQTATSLARGVEQASPGDKTLRVTDVRRALNERRGAIERQVSRMVRLGMLYTYRELSDADLRGYVRFLGSPAGLTFSRAMGEGVVSAMAIAGEAIGRKVVALRNTSMGLDYYSSYKPTASRRASRDNYWGR